MASLWDSPILYCINNVLIWIQIVFQMSFWGLGSNFGIFKQVLGNSPWYLFVKRCCNENLLKILKNWAAPHFSRAEDGAMKFWKVAQYVFAKLSKMGSFNLACVVPKLAKLWHTDFHRQCCEIKQTLTFELLLNRNEI